MKKKKPQSLQAQPLNSTRNSYPNQAVLEKQSTIAAKWHSVSGSIADSQPDYLTTVLYIATNASQIEMACLMSEGSRYKSIIYSEGFDFFECSQKFKKASFCSSIKNIAAIFKKITRIVTYIGQVNPNIKKEYRALLSSALSLSIPIIELPHGLLQSGYNLDDDSKIIDLSSYYDGIGESLPSIASLRLKWYGDSSVGYPRHLNAKPAERSLPAYTVITTNTNWFLYSVEDKRNFFNIVWRFAESNPEKLFIWSPHPAETNQHTYSYSVAALRPANVLMYGLKQDIYFDGIENTNDLIAYCEEGISTVSTCLLEYEIHEKNVKIFSTEGVKKLIDHFDSALVFTTDAEISVPGERLTTGMLEEYNAEKFDDYLACAPNSDPRNSAYLEIA
ncbi:hypothetical protein F3J45_05590 [Pantoea sp. Ap-967]|uniref:hypothetical protein n=1 Tax=Pantoea sp. Ap-967 TaxID=2608362 RepID=UPI00141F2A14|nr:hypothetical protein [Pantoea sp. Ap-967]NIE73917.1 hypothetical protein [Pantoea sp. Ap-967]